MALNRIWVGLFAAAFGTVLWRVCLGEPALFGQVLGGMFDAARSGFELSLGLAGVMCLWLGLMRVGERAGMVAVLARWASPLLRQLFPGVPDGHAAQGAMMLNISANLLGLDNAATPLGLEAMRELQRINAKPSQASDAQIMFVVLNTAGLTLIPTSVIAIRQSLALKQGLSGFNAADIVLPTLLVTAISLVAGLLAVSVCQRLPLWRLRYLLPVAGLGVVLAAVVVGLSCLPPDQASTLTGAVGSGLVLGVIALFLGMGSWRGVNVYEAFVDGASEGFGVAVKIVPYLIAILVAVSAFRGAGCLDWLLQVVARGVSACGIDTAFVPALPVGLMKVLSGAGARGLMIDVMQTHGVDSFAGRLAAIMQGSTETTFYVLAVYFGAVNVPDTRHALLCALVADAVGLVAAVVLGYAMLR
jgi:spore maturation protein SpmA/spore maturation protein SpmB